MKPGALRVLKSHPAYCDLIVHWAQVARPAGWQDDPKLRARVIAEWGELASQPRFMVEIGLRALLRLELIDIDGGLAREALAWIETQQFEDLPRRMREGIEDREKRERERAANDKARQHGNEGTPGTN